MPKLEIVAPRAQIETAMQLAQILDGLDVTKSQYAALHKMIRSYLPAFVQFEQRTPKSVVDVRIEKDGETFKLKVNNRAKVSLLS